MSRPTTRSGPVRLMRLAPFRIAATAALAGVAAGANLLLPILLARTVDAVLAGHGPGFALVALAGLLVTRALAEATGALTKVTTMGHIAAAVRYRLLSHIFALGLGRLSRYPAGDLVTRVTANVSGGVSAVPVLINSVISIAVSLGGLVALWLIDWRLGAVFLLGAVPILLMMRVLVGRVTSSYGEYLERMANIAARLTDALAGGRTIRACGTAELETRRILAPLPELSRCGLRTWAAQRSISWRVDLVLAAIHVVVLAVAGLGVAAGQMTAGDFFAAALYLNLAMGLLEQVDTLIYLADAKANAGRVDELFAEQPGAVPAARGPAAVADPVVAGPAVGRAAIGPAVVGPVVGPAGRGALSLRQVCVRREGQVVLDVVDVDLPGGAAVAVVGRSGAGKSTLAALAGGLIGPDRGEVLLDGARIDPGDRASVRGQVAYAFEKPVLLGRTVRDALTYGCPDVTAPRLQCAVRAAQAEDFIRRLPAGLDTPLADAPLSGGELQRLGLARALAHGGRLLVLDDATSSLDSVTEAKVANSFLTGLAGRTRLIVAHRITTASRVDLVIWLQAGRIRAIGSHQSLWSTEPDYREVFSDGLSPAEPAEEEAA